MTTENCTLEEFTRFITWAAEDYNALKEKTAQSIQSDFYLLKNFSISKIVSAYRQHRFDSNQGMFPPTPAHLRKYLTVEKPAPEKLISMARSKETPIGVLAAIMIGGDLNVSDSFYLRQRALDVLEYFEKWENDFNRNDFAAIEKDFNSYNSGWLKKRFEERKMLESNFSKIGEQKTAGLPRLENQAQVKPVIGLISNLVDKMRANG